MYSHHSTHWPHQLLRYSRHSPISGLLPLLILLPASSFFSLPPDSYRVLPIPFRYKPRYLLLSDAFLGHPIQNFSPTLNTSYSPSCFIFLLSKYYYLTYYFIYLSCLLSDSPTRTETLGRQGFYVCFIHCFILNT